MAPFFSAATEAKQLSDARNPGMYLVDPKYTFI